MAGVSYINNNPLIIKLESIKKEHGISGKFIFKLDLKLPILMWQWKNTIISSHLSQFEPFGLAPVEARLMARDNGPVVVVSDRGGLKEQILSFQDGYVAEYGKEASYEGIIRSIFCKKQAELKKMRKSAYANVIKKYDSYENIFILLTCVSPAIKDAYKKNGSNSK